MEKKNQVKELAKRRDAGDNGGGERAPAGDNERGRRWWGLRVCDIGEVWG